MNPPTVMNPAAAREAAIRLAHDVGKYISRAARNISVFPPPQPLLELLLDDLYALDGEETASRLFETRATDLEALIGPHSALTACRELLCRIDALEPEIRAQNPEAIEEAVRAAISVDDALRELSRSFRERSDA